jgi:insertion element IS1 protein InsB
MEKKQLWIWKALCAVSYTLIAFVTGGRDDKTLKLLLKKIGLKGKRFVTDDWEGYHRQIPEKQLFTGKDLTYPIEQDNSNTRHYLARFHRRSKVTSRSKEMVEISL